VRGTLGLVYTMADQYKKHTHSQHILVLPDIHVGSTETQEETHWIYDASSGKILFNPEFYNVFVSIYI
jgi:hypothetical protein